MSEEPLPLTVFTQEENQQRFDGTAHGWFMAKGYRLAIERFFPELNVRVTKLRRPGDEHRTGQDYVEAYVVKWGE